MKNRNVKFLASAALLFAVTLSYSLIYGDQAPAADKTAGKPDAKPDSATVAAAAELKDNSNCYQCHAQLSGRLQVLDGTWAADTHRKSGITCAQCHGGNGDAPVTMANFKQAHLTAKEGGNFVAIPKDSTGKKDLLAWRKAQPEFCGSCHENVAYMRQFKKDAPAAINAVHRESAHGKALFNHDEASSASCVDCHGAHGAQTGKDVTSLTYPKNIANMCGTCHANETLIKAASLRSAKRDLAAEVGKLEAELLGKGAAKVELEIDAKKQTLSYADVDGQRKSIEKQLNALAEAKKKPADADAKVAALKKRDESLAAVLASVAEKSNIGDLSKSLADKRKELTEKTDVDYVNHIEPYMKSVHANGLYVKNDLGSPTCNDCHSNHGDYLEGTTNVFDACGTCHAANMEAFGAGPHKKAYAERGLNGCVGCHGSPNGHQVAEWGNEKVGIQPGAVCLNCHNPDPESAGNQTPDGKLDEKKYATNVRALGNATKLHASLTGMEKTYDNAKAFYEERKKKGEYIEKEFELVEELKRQHEAAQTMHHMVWADSFKVKMAEGLALSDSVKTLVAAQEAGIAGRQTIVTVVIVMVSLLAMALAAVVSRMRTDTMRDNYDPFYTRIPPSR